MLILLQKNQANQLAAKTISNYYSLPDELIEYPFPPLFTLEKYKNKCCFINSSPNYFAERLLEVKLPTTIQHIYFIVPDNISDTSLMKFAHKFSKVFRDHKRNLEIHVISNINYEKTDIMLNDGTWQIIGTKNQNKKILWEGKDIKSWLNNPQRTFNGEVFHF
jgi:hypothetical protein